jgi:hypothetical protein
METCETLTPPSSDSESGRPAFPYHPPPLKRKKALEEEPDEPRKAAKTSSCCVLTNEENINFVTIYEQRRELEKTEFHLPNFRTFIKNLNDATTSQWETRSEPYKRVFTLLIRWEDDDLGVVQEINDLKCIFGDTYGFDVELWTIASTRDRYQDLSNKIQSSLKEYDTEDSLFILYYGGHARQQQILLLCASPADLTVAHDLTGRFFIPLHYSISSKKPIWMSCYCSTRARPYRMPSIHEVKALWQQYLPQDSNLARSESPRRLESIPLRIL